LGFAVSPDAAGKPPGDANVRNRNFFEAPLDEPPSVISLRMRRLYFVRRKSLEAHEQISHMRTSHEESATPGWA